MVGNMILPQAREETPNFFIIAQLVKSFNIFILS